MRLCQVIFQMTLIYKLVERGGNHLLLDGVSVDATVKFYQSKTHVTAAGDVPNCSSYSLSLA